MCLGEWGCRSALETGSLFAFFIPSAVHFFITCFEKEQVHTLLLNRRLGCYYLPGPSLREELFILRVIFVHGLQFTFLTMASDNFVITVEKSNPVYTEMSFPLNNHVMCFTAGSFWLDGCDWQVMAQNFPYCCTTWNLGIVLFLEYFIWCLRHLPWLLEATEVKSAYSLL